MNEWTNEGMTEKCTIPLGRRQRRQKCLKRELDNAFV